MEPFVDIHCHLIPGIDDGARSWDDALAMARMAVADGIGAIICTPHQMGAFGHNRGEHIRAQTDQLQNVLNSHGIDLRVLPGADVRIENDMVARLRGGDVLTLADCRRHVLLELPHELYFPLEPVLEELEAAHLVGILSHPERNQGLLRDHSLVEPLVDAGCLMQVTAGSLMGTFGPHPQGMAEWMLSRGLVHFIATDAHGPRSRRPLMHRAMRRVAELTDWSTAEDLCCHHPAAVSQGEDTPAGRREVTRTFRLRDLLPWGKAA